MKSLVLAKRCGVFCLHFLLFAAMFWWPQPAFAQKRDSLHHTDSLKVRQLKEVKINAGNRDKQAASASPMQVLSGAELERLNSFSVADAVRYFSGVQLKDYGGVGGLKTVNVRSMGTNHTGVFYDGMEFGNAQNGQVDLGKFSLDNIEELSIYQGQKDALLQPAKGFASASTLYLTTRTPVFKPGQRSIEKIGFKTGSFGLINPSVLWNYKLNQHLYSTFSSEVIESDGRYKFRYTNGVYDTTAVRQNGDLHAQRIEGGLNGKMADSSSWSAKAYLYNSRRGLPGAAVANRFDYSQRQWDQNFFIQGSYKTSTAKRYSLLVNAKYAGNYMRYLDPEIVTVSGLTDSHFSEYEWYASVANRYRINSFWDVSLSVDEQIDKLNANIYRFVYPTRFTTLAALATQLHFNRLNIEANLLATDVDDQVQQYFGAGHKREYTPSVLFSWQPSASPDLHLRGFYKDIFRMPTFNDLYYTFIGNSLLRPEYTKQYDLGVTYNHTYFNRTFSYIFFQADAYYNTVKDKIVAVPGQNLFRWKMENIGKVAVRGIDVTLKTGWDLSALKINTGLVYTYQKAQDVTGDENYNNLIPYAPINSGSALLDIDIKKFSLNYSFIYTGARYDERANIPANYLQPWYTHDAAVVYRTTYQGHQLKLNAEVNNLLNQHYDVIPNFPMPGRNYRFTFQITI